MHSVRLEPTKFILRGTRITYQATRDAGFEQPFFSGHKTTYFCDWFYSRFVELSLFLVNVNLSVSVSVCLCQSVLCLSVPVCLVSVCACLSCVCLCLSVLCLSVFCLPVFSLSVFCLSVSVFCLSVFVCVCLSAWLIFSNTFQWSI